jgi:hypothetical protein
MANEGGGEREQKEEEEEGKERKNQLTKKFLITEIENHKFVINY